MKIIQNRSVSISFFHRFLWFTTYRSVIQSRAISMKNEFSLRPRNSLIDQLISTHLKFSLIFSVRSFPFSDFLKVAIQKPVGNVAQIHAAQKTGRKFFSRHAKKRVKMAKNSTKGRCLLHSGGESNLNFLAFILSCVKSLFFGSFSLFGF